MEHPRGIDQRSHLTNLEVGEKLLTVINERDDAREKLAAAEAELREMEQTFQLRWNADMRAIKRWHEAGYGKLMWPDHADLCLWLMEQLESATPLTPTSG